MLPPPSNQTLGMARRKRHRSEVSIDSTSISRAENRVATLEQRVEKAREEKKRVLLLQREAELLKELEELESFIA
jgi:hypothetical protein